MLTASLQIPEHTVALQTTSIPINSFDHHRNAKRDRALIKRLAPNQSTGRAGPQTQVVRQQRRWGRAEALEWIVVPRLNFGSPSSHLLHTVGKSAFCSDVRLLQHF